jgi:DNA-binding IclR family transcriptional regulator
VFSTAESRAALARSSLFMGSLAKCFRVLESLNQAARPVGLTELAQASGLDRSSVQRITHTLRALGYLRQDPDTKAFMLSGRIVEFGHTALATHRLRRRAQSHLESLNRRTTEAVGLLELDGHEVVCVSRHPGGHAPSAELELHVGARFPAYCTAAGRAILSRLAPADALAQLASAERTSRTPHTVTALPVLDTALESTRRLGYAVSEQETLMGTLSIAAPLVVVSGQPLGAVSIAVSTSRWDLGDVRERLVPQLLDTAATINRDIRYL